MRGRDRAHDRRSDREARSDLSRVPTLNMHQRILEHPLEARDRTAIGRHQVDQRLRLPVCHRRQHPRARALACVRQVLPRRVARDAKGRRGLCRRPGRECRLPRPPQRRPTSQRAWLGAFSGKSLPLRRRGWMPVFRQKNATTHEETERFPIQPNRDALASGGSVSGRDGGRFFSRPPRLRYRTTIFTSFDGGR